MTSLVLALGLVVAVISAARSTWSPCGLSMLSTITPFGERARGHRYAVTAGWFVIGAVVGGATLGVASALLAAVVSVAGLTDHPAALAAIGAGAALVAAAVDTGAFGDVIPLIRRQVDDGWLARYRPWAYGSGFGWQVGVGVVTYVMTAGVFLVAGLAALTGSPVAALVICVAFGLARGLTVFLTAAASDPGRLRALHVRIDRARSVVRTAVIVVEVGAGAVLLGRVWLPGAVIVVPAAVVVAAAAAWPRLARRRVT